MSKNYTDTVIIVQYISKTHIWHLWWRNERYTELYTLYSASTYHDIFNENHFQALILDDGQADLLDDETYERIKAKAEPPIYTKSNIMQMLSGHAIVKQINLNTGCVTGVTGWSDANWSSTPQTNGGWQVNEQYDSDEESEDPNENPQG